MKNLEKALAFLDTCSGRISPSTFKWVGETRVASGLTIFGMGQEADAQEVFDGLKVLGIDSEIDCDDGGWFVTVKGEEVAWEKGGTRRDFDGETRTIWNIKG